MPLMESRHINHRRTWATWPQKKRKPISYQSETPQSHQTPVSIHLSEVVVLYLRCPKKTLSLKLTLRSLPKCPNPKRIFIFQKFIIPLMEEILHQLKMGEVSISCNLQELYTFQVVGLGISSISNSVVSWGNFPTSQGATEPLPTGHGHQGVQGFFLTSHASKAGCTR